MAFPVYSNGLAVNANDFPKYLNAQGQLIGDSLTSATSFASLTGSNSFSGNVDFQNHSLLNADIALQIQNIVPADNTTVYPIDTTMDVIIINTNNFSCQLSLANASISKRLTIRLLFARGLSANITTASNEVIILDAATPLVNLAFNGTDWFILSSSKTVSTALPNFANAPLKIIPTGYIGPQVLAGNYVGIAMSNDGNTIIVGAPVDNAGVGTAFVFEYNGTTWIQQDILFATSGLFGAAGFGNSVAITGDGNTCFIGAFQNNTAPNTDYGIVYEFTRTGTIWSQTNIFLPTGVIGTTTIQFGTSLCCSVDGKILFVGCLGDDSNKGSVFIFSKASGSWVQKQRYVTTDTDATAATGNTVVCTASGNLCCVASSGDNSNTGACNVIMTTDFNTWNQVGSKFFPSGAVSGALFGLTMSMSADGSTLLCGDYNNDTVTGGFVSVYNLSSGYPTELSYVKGSDGIGDTGEGFSGVCCSEDGSIMSSGGATDNSNVGAQWFFLRHGQNWVQYGPKLVPTDAIGNSHFGWNCTISSNGSIMATLGITDNTNIGAIWIYY